MVFKLVLDIEKVKMMMLLIEKQSQENAKAR